MPEDETLPAAVADDVEKTASDAVAVAVEPVKVLAEKTLEMVNNLATRVNELADRIPVVAPVEKEAESEGGTAEKEVPHVVVPAEPPPSEERPKQRKKWTSALW